MEDEEREWRECKNNGKWPEIEAIISATLDFQETAFALTPSTLPGASQSNCVYNDYFFKTSNNNIVHTRMTFE